MSQDVHGRYSSHGLHRQTYGCTCEGTLAKRKSRWIVITFKANYSAFNGYRRTPSDYSQVRCTKCGRIWRTKANYVEDLPVNEGLVN